MQALIINPLKVAISLATIGLICCIASPVGGDASAGPGASGRDSDTTYGVIVDCGSSGTRAHIYHWDSKLIYPAFLNDIDLLRDENNKPISLKKEPGLSSMKDEPEKASDYMEPLLKFITSHIPIEAQASTGIYIMATAGMRLLAEELQEQIMNDIVQDIKTKYNFAKVASDVISGAQEGMYEWITVNSKAKRLAPVMAAGKRATGAKKTYALIEMGGASLQVAYQLQPHIGRKVVQTLPQKTGAKPAFLSQRVEPNISRENQGAKYELHSTSFLGLGSNSARSNYLDMLITAADRQLENRVSRFLKTRWFSSGSKSREDFGPQVVKDPCLPRGASELVSKPKRMLAKTETRTLGFSVENDEPEFTVKIVGEGNHSACIKKVRKFLIRCREEGLHCKPGEACTMHLLGTQFVPFDEYEFLGLGEFYYTTSSMMKLDGIYDHAKVVASTREMCELSISQLERKYPDANEFDKSRSKTECFKAVFVDTFLTKGLMMPKTFRNLANIAKIGDDSIDWTLGAVLDKSLTIELAADEKGDDSDDDDEFEDHDEFENYQDDDDDDEEEDEDDDADEGDVGQLDKGEADGKSASEQDEKVARAETDGPPKGVSKSQSSPAKSLPPEALGFSILGLTPEMYIGFEEYQNRMGGGGAASTS